MPQGPVLRSEVLSTINLIFNDTANAKWSVAQKEEAYAMAFPASWPRIKYMVTDSSVVLSTNTFEYTPSNAPMPELGWSLGYVTLPNNPKILLRRLRQRLDTTFPSGAQLNPKILVPPDIVASYVGETLHLQAMVHHDVSGVANTTFLPRDYLWKATAYHLCLSQMVSGAHFDVNPYRELAQFYKREMEDSLNAHRTHDLPSMIPWVNDVGAGDIASGRYGQGILITP